MPANKPRLYIGLYARGKLSNIPGREYKYHWAILLGPKTDRDDRQGIRYHAKQIIKDGKVEWIFEEGQTTMTVDNMLLVRVVIGKVKHLRLKELLYTLRCTPIRQDEPGWDSVSWVEAAVRLIADQKLVSTGVTKWKYVKKAALWYCERKENEHYFDGKKRLGWGRTLTYDLFENEEIIS